MAQSFDILGGQYLAMIDHLRATFTQGSRDRFDVTLTGTVKTKPKSVTIEIEGKHPYYLTKIDADVLSGGMENYSGMPPMRTVSLAHIHAALSLTGLPRTAHDWQSLRALIFITCEAARFEPFARHVSTLIDEGDGARVLDYSAALFYINEWDNIVKWTQGSAPYFQPVTEANMHNYNYHFRLVVHKQGGNMNLPFSQTQASLRPKSLADLR